MEVVEISLPYGKADEFHLYTFGDAHGGILHCAENELAKQVRVIRDDPLAYWVDMGDKGEFISPSDPRWDVGVIADWVHQDNIAVDQQEWYCDMVAPITKKCLGLLEGNHEDAIRIHSHIDVHKNICKSLGVRNLGYSAFLKLIFKRNRSKESHLITGFLAHGSGWAITKGAKLNKLQRVMDAFQADYYALGHMHDIITDSKPYLTVDANNRIKQREKVGAITGCWFKTYAQGIRASYGEKRNYPPTAIGCPVFTIKPNTQEITVEG